MELGVVITPRNSNLVHLRRAGMGMADRHQIVYLRHLAESQGYGRRRSCGGKAAQDDSQNQSGDDH